MKNEIETQPLDGERTAKSQEPTKRDKLKKDVFNFWSANLQRLKNKSQ